MTTFDKKLCFCLRPKNKRKDFLFKDAKKKLLTEIDLLEIVKKMRVSMFASDIILKPRQQKLVSFFHEYKITPPKDEGKQTKE